MFSLETIQAMNERVVKPQEPKTVNIAVRYSGEEAKFYTLSETTAKERLDRLEELARWHGYKTVRFSETGFTGTNWLLGKSQTVVILH